MPAACAVLHWESMARLQACIGDSLLLCAASGERIVLFAWASACVPAGCIAVADDVRWALGLPRGVAAGRLRAWRAWSGAPTPAMVLELCVQNDSQDDAFMTEVGCSGGSWIGLQLLGWPVATGCLLPLRLLGQLWRLRVASAVPLNADSCSLDPALASHEPPLVVAPERILLASPSTRIAVISVSRARQKSDSSACRVQRSWHAHTQGHRIRPSVTLAAHLGGRVPREVAGFTAVTARVLETIELPLMQRGLFAAFGLAPPTGVLLHGPPGSGKTVIARSVCRALNVHVAETGPAHLLSNDLGDADAALAGAFLDARAHAPAVLFIDEIDGLGAVHGTANAAGEIGRGTDGRLFSQLLLEMDGLRMQPEPVLVLGATNRPAALDPALRRPGRFDSEIEVGVPSEADRRRVLASLLESTPHSLQSDQLDGISNCTAGFVGADLAALHRHAALTALGRNATTARASDAAGVQASETTDFASRRVGCHDYASALRSVRPSALREVESRVPTVSWSDIGGQELLKAALAEAVEWPLRHRMAFDRVGIRPSRGVLLYGPPGCSKTLVARALAAQSRTNFLAVKGPELFSKWVGESERAVAALFRRARAAAPAIIFFDEIDALAAKRTAGGGSGGAGVGSRVLSQLLHEMDGVTPLASVLVMAATNRPDLVDDALLRPGRFDTLLHVSLPDEPSRQQVLQIHARSMPLTDDVDLAQVARRTPGYSGAELAAMIREAGLAALEDNDGSLAVGANHLQRALAIVTPRTSCQTAACLESFRAAPQEQQ